VWPNRLVRLFCASRNLCPRGARARVLELLGLFECLLGLNREADGDLGRAVEYLENLVAEQAAELSLGPWPRGEFNPAVAGVALRTGDIGFFHFSNMRQRPPVRQPRHRHIQLIDLLIPRRFGWAETPAGRSGTSRVRPDQQELEQCALAFVFGSRTGLFQPAQQHIAVMVVQLPLPLDRAAIPDHHFEHGGGISRLHQNVP
jgi:hypothetical protein